jgi:hypothetical protein
MVDEYEYDVAFSFLAQDEIIANQLNDALSGRVKTFLYSEQQKNLAGTDGEKTFNAVFERKSRSVAILYRNAWGSTPWTRIEETAIRNRAHDEGYDFALLIPLDKPPTTPPWFPKNRLWLGLERWGIQAAAAVVEARLQELGGSPYQETLEERAARQARDVAFRAEKEAALNSFEGVEAFRQRIGFVTEAINDGVQRINSKRTAHKLECRPPSQIGGPCYVLGLRKGLSVGGRAAYTNTLENVFLEARLWNGSPPIPGYFFDEDPTVYMTEKYQLDYLASRTYIWTKVTEPSRSFSSNDLAEEILKWLFDNGGDPAW